MANFYFTFGNSGHPYEGGWIMVKAPSIVEAKQWYRSKYPDKEPGVLHCAGIYTQEQFQAAGFEISGNLGVSCHAVIDLLGDDYEVWKCTETGEDYFVKSFGTWSDADKFATESAQYNQGWYFYIKEKGEATA